jgi:hypothetical protein
MLSNHPNILGGNGGGVSSTVIGGIGLFANGTNAAPSISFINDTDTGFYRVTANQIGVALGGGALLELANVSGCRLREPTNNASLNLLSAGGITLAASGTNQNITLTPSGTGIVETTGASAAQTLRVTTTAASASDLACLQLKTGASALVWQPFARNGDFFIGVQSVADYFQIKNTTGRVLIGTGGADSGALLQVGTNTTAASGGMVFGTDNYLYRVVAGGFRFDSSATDTFLSVNGLASFGKDATSPYLFGNSLRFRTGAGTTALTLDTSQRTILSGALCLANAYVAGAVVGTGYVTIQDSTGTTYRVPVLV